ncbi:ribosome biogenesis protein SLX9 homolog isoform X1 [Peromyscus californicus insignis]|uniref:ribosome biogenesis protein SLX9 homolog isoform X1 n=1 Tax=Peromyscus californicus insignis TaxID=564181 RepID=UPI0022A6F82E|nr:ribosome biogenesis protein SLX9 homolog isoform X1 [Peromyscus californicus insignis]
MVRVRQRCAIYPHVLCPGLLLQLPRQCFLVCIGGAEGTSLDHWASDFASDWTLVHNDIFARTKIDPSALVQRLELDQKSVVSLKRGTEPKTILPKKEKLRLRHERWLQKIEAIKLAEQKLKEERRRRATVVVGDLHPLRDALPELQELEASRRQHTRSRVTSKPRPVELSRMSTAQRQQLLEEERTRFRELLASPSYRASPLLAIGRQLAHQMQLEGGKQL